MTTENKKCPLCGWHEIKIAPLQSALRISIFCECCKNYEISNPLLMTEEINIKNGYIFSGISREFYETGREPPKFLKGNKNNVEEILKEFPFPDLNDPKAKAYKLLDRVRGQSKYFGEPIKLHQEKDKSLAYAKNLDEFQSLIVFLQESRLIKIHDLQGPEYKLELTANGWDLANKRKVDSNQGFIAIWFADSMNESITAIEQAIKDAGFDAMCIKEKYYSGT
ncbi:hypothetical protein KKB18_12860, partial [bacterium]|nr:hypothetical protein [bacterium]